MRFPISEKNELISLGKIKNFWKNGVPKLPWFFFSWPGNSIITVQTNCTSIDTRAKSYRAQLVEEEAAAAAELTTYKWQKRLAHLILINELHAAQGLAGQRSNQARGTTCTGDRIGPVKSSISCNWNDGTETESAGPGAHELPQPPWTTAASNPSQQQQQQSSA